MRPDLTLAAAVIAATALGAAAAPAVGQELSSDVVFADLLDPLGDGDALLPPDTVVIDGATWDALQPPRAPDDPTLPGPAPTFRIVRLRSDGDLLQVHATWLLDTFEPGWFDAILAPPTARDVRVLWDGGPAAYDTTSDGTVVTGRVDGPVTLELRCELPFDVLRADAQLNLLAAPRGAVVVEPVAGYSPHLSGASVVWTDEGRFWSGDARLVLGFDPERAAVDKGTLVHGTVGLGVTLGDSELVGRARLGWTVLRGRLDRLSFTARGVGDDLQVSGPGVRSVSRSGDRVTVELQAPVTSSTTLDLKWTAALPSGGEGQVTLPTLIPDGVARSEATAQLARDGEWEALPEMEGWEARSASSLPPWGRGLVEGTPTAAYSATTAGRSGRLSLLRFDPVAGPPVMVDVADYLVATTSEGRTLMRARYEVRNELGSHLEVLPPFGARFLTVRVRDRAAEPVRAEGGGWRIPLERSLETVEGLLSFPVEVVLLMDGEPWGRREIRALELPQVDAPVAVARVTLHLPPGYTELASARSDRRRVEDFTEGEGISYGFKAGTKGEAATGGEVDKTIVADELFNSAVDAWMDNDFDQAQGYLDSLSTMGASNDNTVRLQSNLDVVFDGSDEENDNGEGKARPNAKVEATGATAALRRRVREQASARASEDRRVYEEERREAEQLQFEGRYEEAEKSYKRAMDVGRKLELLDQEESAEFSSKNAEIEQQLAEVTVSREYRAKAKKKARDLSGSPSPKPPARAPAPAASTPPMDRSRLGLLGSGRGGGGSRGGSGSASTHGSGYGYGTMNKDVGGDDGVEEDSRRKRFVFEDSDLDAYVIEGHVHRPDVGYILVEPEPEPDYHAGIDLGVATGDGERNTYLPTEVPMSEPLVLPPSTVDVSRQPVLTVTSATRSVPIPRIGQPVRFQQLLLPAGATHEVTLRARLPRSEGTP